MTNNLNNLPSCCSPPFFKVQRLQAAVLVGGRRVAGSFLGHEMRVVAGSRYVEMLASGDEMLADEMLAAAGSRHVASRDAGE
ncbi:unnamed protein product [Linum trigynum]|uniref:Uncharacterized protein n=1 Tax=Linum trigynum TaxID=586398 RepID=A0AAV2FTE0_9ROSI